MKITNLLLFIFLIAAFTIGAQYTSEELVLVHENINTNLQNLTNVELITQGNNELVNDLLTIIEKFAQFFLTVGITVMKIGINFGSENPEYFETVFLLKMFKYLLIFYVIALIAKPLFYVGILVILSIMSLIKRLREKKKVNT